MLIPNQKTEYFVMRFFQFSLRIWNQCKILRFLVGTHIDLFEEKATFVYPVQSTVFQIFKTFIMLSCSESNAQQQESGQVLVRIFLY